MRFGLVGLSRDFSTLGGLPPPDSPDVVLLSFPVFPFAHPPQRRNEQKTEAGAPTDHPSPGLLAAIPAKITDWADRRRPSSPYAFSVQVYFPFWKKQIQ